MRLIALFTVLALTGCSDQSAYTYNKMMNESRIVQVATDVKKNVIVTKVISLMDGLHPTGAVTMHAGTFTLEAEDSEYWYLRSPTPLSFLECKEEKMCNERKLPGGIMIGKSQTGATAVGIYTDGANSTKVMAWKLGPGFIDLQGKDWKQNLLVPH